LKKFLIITVSILFLFLNIHVIANAASNTTVPNDTSSAIANSPINVTFNSNGGLDVLGLSVEYNDKAVAPANSTKMGYTFEGWYTDDTTFANLFDFENTAITQDITLFAKWTINKYTITFNSQGGSNVSSRGVDYNNVITAPIAPTKTGYTFWGWYKDAGCLNSWNFITDKVTDNTTLFAKWIIVAPGIPKNLKATIYSYSSINLTWSAVALADGYEIYRATSSTGTYIPIMRATALNYTNTGLLTGKTYYYKISSYRINGQTRVYSNLTALVSGTTTSIVYNSLVQSNAVYGKYLGLKVEIKDETNNTFLIKEPNGSQLWVACNKVSVPSNPATNTKYLDKKQLETYVNITSNFVSTTKYFTWVDLNRQRVNIFTGGAKHWVLLKTYSCASGNNITPSKRGLFTVQDKGYSFVAGPGAIVKYWTRYSGNYMLHSVILNNSGSVIDGTLGKRVSHGCIRMPLDMAKWYYDNIPKGSLIWVN